MLATILLLILAVFLPRKRPPVFSHCSISRLKKKTQHETPALAVGIRRGCGLALLLNIILTLLGWLPGVIHAWFIVLVEPSVPT